MKGKFICTILFLALLTGTCGAKGTKTFYVADRKVACAGNYECIQIREKTKDAWRVYADTIDGFKYEEGYAYKIRVQPFLTKDNFSGLYDEKYTFIKVISKKKTSFNPAEKLAGKKWIIRSLDDTHRVLSIPDTSLVIQFDIKEGKLRGKNVCNNFTGNFTTESSKIALNNIGATKMMCKGQQLEDIIFDFYKSTTTYNIAGNTLTLYQPNGSNMVLEGR